MVKVIGSLLANFGTSATSSTLRFRLANKACSLAAALAKSVSRMAVSMNAPLRPARQRSPPQRHRQTQ